MTLRSKDKTPFISTIDDNNTLEGNITLTERIDVIRQNGENMLS
jgi:hypothetical protein